MAASASRPPLVAVDANVLFDLAAEWDEVVDAVSLIRERLVGCRLLIPPTVQHELANWALRELGPNADLARKAIRLSQSWWIVPVNLIPAAHGIAEQIAQNLREQELIPEEEFNDSLVLVESALLGCSMLLSSDEHLRGIDFEQLTLALQAFDVVPPIIATPREIVRKFLPR
jgi:hypothetical protein